MAIAPKIEWLDTYKTSSGTQLKKYFTQNANAKWTKNKNYFWTLDAQTGQQLGIAPVMGKYYISPNDIAWIIQAAQDPSAAETVKPYQGAINNLLEKMLTLSSYKNVSAFRNAALKNDKTSAAVNLVRAVDDAMTGPSNLIASASKIGRDPVDFYDFISYRIPSTSPRTQSWTRNQFSQIANFMGNWIGFQNPAINQEIAGAINSGLSAYEVEQQLYSSNPDSSLAVSARSFQNAFPALVKSRQDGTDIGINSPAEYLQVKNNYLTALRPYGLDKEFDNKELDSLMTNGVTNQDLGKWAGMTWEMVQNADPQLKANLKEAFGISDKDLQAYLLRPENVGSEKITDAIRANKLYTQGQSAGVTLNDAYRLTGLVDQGDISQQQAQQAVQKAAAMQNLGQEAFGFQQGTQTTANAQDIMGAVVPEFAPNATAAAESARTVQRAQEERAQATKAGGNLLTNQSGVKGAGRAQ